jgi:hypothetical protein
VFLHREMMVAQRQRMPQIKEQIWRPNPIWQQVMDDILMPSSLDGSNKDSAT